MGIIQFSEPIIQVECESYNFEHLVRLRVGKCRGGNGDHRT